MASSFTVPCPKCFSSAAQLGLKSQIPQRNVQTVSFQSRLSLKKSLSFGPSIRDLTSSGIRCLNKKQVSAWKFKAQPNEVTTIEQTSNSAPVRSNGPKAASSKEKDDHNGKPSGPCTSMDASSISAFMNQVSDLIKLVDSRDVVELQLKQADCELMIRKKEALQPPPTAAVVPLPQQLPYPTIPSLPPQPPAAASAPASPLPSKAAPALPSPGKASTSSHPPLKCPMAGTLYRSPAPGEPPFVKVGDKVQKGQVICIIEAMKLMNEIEADQSGTVAEILVDDGKPVSVDTPLFVIVP